MLAIMKPSTHTVKIKSKEADFCLQACLPIGLARASASRDSSKISNACSPMTFMTSGNRTYHKQTQPAQQTLQQSHSLAGADCLKDDGLCDGNLSQARTASDPQPGQREVSCGSKYLLHQGTLPTLSSIQRVHGKLRKLHVL